MVFSVQQIYRNYVALLTLVLVMVLLLSLSLSSFMEVRGSAAHALQLQANMIAQSVADLSEDEEDAIESDLRQSLVNPMLVLACLLDQTGDLRYFIKGNEENREPMTESVCGVDSHIPLAEHYIAVHAPVVDPMLPRPIGEVVLVADAPRIGGYFWGGFTLSVLLALVIGFLCLILGARLEESLLKPIRNIAKTAQRVSLYKDYSLRVQRAALEEVPRELDALTDAFNTMLHEIEDRDMRLTRKSDELEKSQRAVELASRAKSQFLANVSHELRTPLNAVIGFSTMLSDQKFGPLGHQKYIDYARDIHDSGKHLLDVINDILDLTKAETGALTVTFKPVSFEKVVQKALNIVAAHAHERKVDVYTSLPEKMPKIYADRVRLMQILLNLLSNAIKFTHEGGHVVVRAFLEPAKHGIHYLTIEVEDTGIGMSDADVKKVFSAFNQVDAGLNRKYEGAGLGLLLTKRLVELHHGKIKIRSVEGKGTTVTVRLTSDPALVE